MRRSRAGAFCAVAVLGLLAAPAANAVTMNEDDGVLEITLAPNELVVSVGGFCNQRVEVFARPGAGQDSQRFDHEGAVERVRVVAPGTADNEIAAKLNCPVEINGGAGNDTIQNNGQSRSRLVGGTGDDSLTDFAAKSVLIGGAGRDTIAPGGGRDKAYGGPGRDTVTYSSRSDGVRLAVGETSAKRTEDVVQGFEELIGTTNSDRIIGGPAREEIHGLGGHDLLDGGPGADTVGGGEGRDIIRGGDQNDKLILTPDGLPDRVAGGDGFDFLDYSNTSANLTIDLRGAANSGPAGEQDRIGSDVEAAKGGGGDDRMRGNDGRNTLDGGGGIDLLDGGRGRDLLDGGTHPGDVEFPTETVSYAGRTAPIRAVPNTASSGEAGEKDIIRNIQRIVGGSGDDHILGFPIVQAGSGDDEIFAAAASAPPLRDDLGYEGGPGDDIIRGGPGLDWIFGGPGNDTLTGAGGVDGIHGGSGNDRIDGGLDADVIWGEAGRDTLVGGLGDDGFDAVDGEQDHVTCGDGNDRVQADQVDRLVACEQIDGPDGSGRPGG